MYSWNRILAVGILVALAFFAVPARAQHHTADTTPNQIITLSELLRVIQFYNAGGLHCANGTEDGFAPGSDALQQACAPHDSDYQPQNWLVSLSELLRLIQIYNAGSYSTQCGTEDNFAPVAGALSDCVAEGEGEGEGEGECSGCLLWSDPATWGGAVPVDGDEVVIEHSMQVLLDVNSAALDGLTIHGSLTFDRADLTLTSDWIMVHGALRVGSEAEPFAQRATFTLTGDDPDQSVMNMGTRGIMVMGGLLELHGTPPAVPWTKIAAHAEAGATALSLVEPVGWQPGDEVVVAPTDFYGVAATERFTLASVGGTSLGLGTPLQDFRWGLLQYATNTGMALAPDPTLVTPLPDTPTVLDERAEVGMLTRNIVIQAPEDALWQNLGFGAHVMIMSEGGTAHVDGVEFRRGGQRGRLGRYPFHWHMLSYHDTIFDGDTVGQYLRNSTVNQSANRGIVIHGTNGVTVQDNVVYDVLGHGIFTEDAVERRNTITGNLVLRVRNQAPADALKLHEFDAPGNPPGGASGFWLSNPDNTIRGNAVADCAAFGYWLAYPANPWGASIGIAMQPNRLRFGVFEDNAAHSNRLEGLMLDNVEISNTGLIYPLQYASTADGLEPEWPFDNLERFTLLRLSTWKNGRGGVWDRSRRPNNLAIVSADNCGRFFAGSGDDGLIERCLVVGNSLNNASPRPTFNDSLGGNESPAAFATYHSTFDIRNNVVINFPLVDNTRSGVFATEDYYIRPVDKGHVRNVDNLIIDAHQGYRSLSPFPYYTLAGALWDPHGTWGPAGNYFVYDNTFLTYGQTITPVAPGASSGGVSCPGPYYGFSDFVVNNLNEPYADLMAIAVNRLNADLNTVATWTVETAQQGWLLDHMRHFAAHADGLYELRFPDLLPVDLEITFENFLTADDTLVIGVEFSGEVTPTVYIGAHPFYQGYTAVGSLQEVRDSDGETWWQDTENDRVWVKLRGGFWQFWDQSGQFAAPTSDDLLYEPQVLHINSDPL